MSGMQRVEHVRRGTGEWKALSTSGKIKPATEAKPVPLSAIKTSDEERISTSMPELDRVLGGEL